MIVIDASVGVKWFLDEHDASVAEQLLIERSGRIIAPDLFLVEVAGALVRIANEDKATGDLMQSALVRLSTMALEREFHTIRSDEDVVQEAGRLAISLGHPIKDCLYLQHAIAQGVPLVTADAIFRRKAVLRYPGVILLGDYAA